MAKPHVLVIPYPAQGHVIPTIELSRRLVEQGIKVTFVNTEVNHELVTSNWLDSKDGFGDLMQMISIPDGLEPWEDRSDICKLTLSILQTMPSKLEELIETINKEDNSTQVSCVIADACMGWAIKVAKKMGISGAAFWPASVATLASILSFQKLIDDGFINNKGVPLKDQAIQLSKTMPPIKPQNLGWAGFLDVATIEAFFQNPVSATVANRPSARKQREQSGHFWQEDPTCLTWLDQQQPCSVVYIAFGSFTIFNKTQFEELALGLELSNKPFLWVVRPGMTKETTLDYPDGFMERVSSRGRIVSWAPQQKVLTHPSVACFVSHCGWNSTLEGVTNGLPFLCWPYFADQFHNEAYICDIWKTGLRLDKDEAGIITRGEIKSKVEELMSDETFGVKAKYIKENVTNGVRKGGCSHKNLDNFIEWIQEKSIDIIA
ncbi:hypothetical protein SSX86_029107 [Deinandra increscens subsp. villosa]|uniref:Uncharacterized protein n=1 Tax=Deinandra increscens subsp. villosa TaxID=3103831 RepID=A0AAP0CFI3_9ASTR